MTDYYVQEDGGLIYCFDGSDEPASDPNSVWTGEENTDDCDVETYASTTTAGSSASNYINIGGTNAPASGDSITSVDVRVRMADVTTNLLGYAVRTDGWSESLISRTETQTYAGRYTPWRALSTPTGGWTWEKVQALEFRAWNNSGGTVGFSKVQIAVNMDGTLTRPFTEIYQAEAVVSSGSTVYIAPGVYREPVTLAASGGSGTPITYQGDVTGEVFGVMPGPVRITGSNNDKVGNSSYCIDSSGYTYREFKSLCFDGARTSHINAVTLNGWLIEDCYFGSTGNAAGRGLSLDPAASGDSFIVRRCIFLDLYVGIYLLAGTPTSALIENCLILGCLFRGIWNNGMTGGTVVVNNCTIVNCNTGIYAQSITTMYVYNSIVAGCNDSFYSLSTNDVTEDYNAVLAISRYQTTTGSNTIDPCLPLFSKPLLYDGLSFLTDYWGLGPESTIKHITGSNPASDDLYGITRPTTNSKKSWGAIQHDPLERSTENPRGQYIAHVRFPDAGAQLMFVPVDPSTQFTVTIYAYRGADYAGTLPQMIIREIGQSDRTTTDTGAAGQYNELSDTFTPGSSTEYVVIELRSNNSAISGDYFVDFDDFDIVET